MLIDTVGSAGWFAILFMQAESFFGRRFFAVLIGVKYFQDKELHG